MVGGFVVSIGDDEQFTWRKSSKSNFAGCVEVCFTGGGVAVRDSRDPDGPVLHFTAAQWTAFLAGAAAHEFDLP